MNLNTDSHMAMASNLQSPFSSLSTTQSLERFTKVVELLHSNKLSKNNAFEHRMIDFIENVFKSIEESKGDTESIWQRYSAGIDSCAKIYGFCVDYLYNEAYKVLGGLNRAGKEEPCEANEEEIDGKVKKAKRKGLEGVNTLETDEQAITTTKFDKFEYFDPFFKVVSSKFDASNMAGLLLNNLSLSGGINLVLGADDLSANFEIIDNGPQFLAGTFNYLASSEFANEDISNALVKFIGTTEINDQQLQGVLENMTLLNDAFSQSESEASLDLNDEIFNDPDVFECKAKENSMEFELSTRSLQEKINSLAERDDYNYFNNPKISSWGGLDYWKKTLISRSGLEKVPRKKKEPTGLILDGKNILKKSEILAPARKGYPNYYNDAALLKFQEANSKVPEDYGFSLHRLTQLFTRPQTQVKYVKNLEVKNIIVDQISKETNEETDFYAEELPKSMEIDYGENLKTATVSKTVDIKKLKETMWKNLCFDNDKENQQTRGKKNSFMALINVLPSCMPSQEVANLSIHSCFISLLHLANEHNLVLKADGNCEILISQCR